MNRRRRIRRTSSRRLALAALLLSPLTALAPSLPSPDPPSVVSFDDFVDAQAHAHGVPTNVVRGMIRAESSGDPKARGRHGEVGLLQVKPSTARAVMNDPGLRADDLTNPVLNVEAGLRYLSGLRDEFDGDLSLALLAYNRGPGKVREDLRGRVPLAYAYPRRVHKLAKREQTEQEKRLNRLSVIIPSYRNPSYLRLALSNFLAGRDGDSEIVVVVDGFREMYEDLMKEFSGKVRFVVLKVNVGMQNAINLGVAHARNPYVLVTNEDVVPGRSWDRIVAEDCRPGRFLGIDCIEPNPGSLFGFPHFDAGKTLAEFRLEDFHSYEFGTRENRLDGKSFVIPFAMHKADFMKVGGFDGRLFSGPYLVDDDFFLRVQLSGIEAVRTVKVRFYHFSGKSTKFRDDGGTGTNFFEVERGNYTEFVRKWDFRPTRDRETNAVVAVGVVPEYLEGRVRSI